ncbi:MAG TPA: SDR family oxidoreductase [Chitinophagales bacterium]|nr:SDR family oxidoreductase [Chitinophagales bacterium]
MTNEYAIITGASSGIGLEFSKLLAKKGYNLVLVARRTDRLEKLKAEILQTDKIDIQLVSMDLSEKEAPNELLAFTQKNNLTISVLVNNAGFGANGEFFSVPIERTIEMLNLNMVTLTHLTYLFGLEMKKNNNGYILQVASIGAFQPSPYVSAYSATKAYVMLFSEGLDFELKDSNVSVTTLYPGATRTEFFEVSDTKINAIIENSMQSAKKVASIALNAMFKRQRSIVPGFMNKLTAFITQLSPRKLTTWAAAKLMH